MGPDADKVNAYFVTVDPERDTPAAMKDYLSSFDPHLKGLTGTPDEIAKVVAGYRVYARKVPLKDGDYTMDHTALVYLMDRDGRFVAPFNLKRTPRRGRRRSPALPVMSLIFRGLWSRNHHPSSQSARLPCKPCCNIPLPPSKSARCARRPPRSSRPAAWSALAASRGAFRVGRRFRQGARPPPSRCRRRPARRTRRRRCRASGTRGGGPTGPTCRA